MPLSPEAFQRILEAFDAAMALPDGERDAYVRGAFPGETDLGRELELMLSGHRTRDDFLRTPGAGTLAQVTSTATPSVLAPGDRIGEFTLVRPIGAGGMGTVWEAVQERPKRSVAVKTMRTGLAPTAARRFQEEAELLARLSHPGVARLLAAGVLEGPDGEAGTPWFAMDLVEGGKPIHEHARDQGLDLQRRIELLREVCDAVHHGHQRGVIHRDLKPDNVLVGADGRPRVIDFGIARATDATPGALELTSDGELVGTLSYMSPEQLRGDRNAIDLRADVHALGVLLYVLICDRTPWEGKERSLSELGRMILEEDPPAPGTLSGGIPHELDWIVARAMAKDPDRRYPSADALGADLRRLLNHEPVEARPASTLYLMAKFVRRNRPLVAGSAAALLCLVLAVVGTGYGLFQAARERDSALRSARRSEAVQAFMLDVFTQANAKFGGREATVLEALDGADRLAAEAFADEPEIRADVLQAMGQILHSLGDHDWAQELLRTALDLRHQTEGPDHPDTLGTVLALVELLSETGTLERPGVQAEAVALVEAALPAARSLPELDQTVLVGLLHRRTYFAEADQEFDLALALAEEAARIAGEEFPGTLLARTMQQHLVVLRDTHMGGHVDVGRLAGEAENIVSRLGENHPDTFAARSNEAFGLQITGKLEEAEAILRDVLPRMLDELGSEHPETAMVRNQLWQCLTAQDEYAGAADVLREALAARRAAGTVDDPFTRTLLMNLGWTLHHTEDWDEMAEALEEAHAGALAELGPGDPSTLNLAGGAADARLHQGRTEAALELADSALAAADPEGTPGEVLTLRSARCRALFLAGRGAEAEPELAALLTDLAAKGESGAIPPKMFLAVELGHLAQTLEGQGRADEAQALRDLTPRPGPPGR